MGRWQRRGLPAAAACPAAVFCSSLMLPAPSAAAAAPSGLANHGTRCLLPRPPAGHPRPLQDPDGQEHHDAPLHPPVLRAHWQRPVAAAAGPHGEAVGQGAALWGLRGVGMCLCPCRTCSKQQEQRQREGSAKTLRGGAASTSRMCSHQEPASQPALQQRAEG